MYKLTKPGIPSIRDQVHAVRPLLVQLLPHQQRNVFSRKIMSEEQSLELITRRAIAETFTDMELPLSPTQKEPLRIALFEVCFPLEIVINEDSR